MSPESTPLPPQHAPVVSHKGTITCQTETGDIASFVAAPYEHANAGSRAPSDVWERYASKFGSLECTLKGIAFSRERRTWMSKHLAE